MLHFEKSFASLASMVKLASSYARSYLPNLVALRKTRWRSSLPSRSIPKDISQVKMYSLSSDPNAAADGVRSISAEASLPTTLQSAFSGATSFSNEQRIPSKFGANGICAIALRNGASGAGGGVVANAARRPTKADPIRSGRSD